MLSLTLHISDPLSIFPLYLFSFFSSSFSLTLGPNELCSLVVISSQMCCCSCQCNGMVCDAYTHIHTRSHTPGPLPTHQNSADAQVTMLFYPTSTSLSYCQLPQCFMLLLFLLFFPTLPASPLKLHNIEPYVQRTDP